MKKSSFLFLAFLTLILACGPSGYTSDDSEESEQAIQVPTDTGIPLIKIKSSKTIEDEPKVKAQMTIALNDSNVFDGAIGIEIRGAVSQMFYRKKSYGFEIRDEANKGKQASLLGMPENEDWVLHGPYGDKTLLRNVVAYQISNNIGRYAPRTKFVELEINNKYLGVYVLMEKMKRGKNRIAVSKLEETDNGESEITGGYILKLDKTMGAGSNIHDDYTDLNSFRSKFDIYGKPSKKSIIHFLFDDPKPKSITSAQSAYIKNYINEFETALVSPNFKDEILGYPNYIDVPSFIDFFILTELMQNHDGYRLSTYLQKDRGQKLKMGPIWDFDIAFGSDGGGCYPMNTNNWVFQYNKFCVEDMWLIPFWWKRLLEDPNFKNQLIDRWKTLRQNELADTQLEKNIEDNYQIIAKSGAVDRNFQKWIILKKSIFPNQFTGTHIEEIERMKKWLLNHAKWIDKNISNAQ